MVMCADLQWVHMRAHSQAPVSVRIFQVVSARQFPQSLCARLV